MGTHGGICLQKRPSTPAFAVKIGSGLVTLALMGQFRFGSPLVPSMPKKLKYIFKYFWNSMFGGVGCNSLLSS
jgi:hypothetical protein